MTDTLHGRRTNPKYSEFHFISYPLDYNMRFHHIGRTTGNAGYRPIAKYILDGKKFVTYLCYGTNEHPNTDFHFMTLIPDPFFGEQSYEEIETKVTNKILQARQSKYMELLKDTKLVMIDFSKLNKPRE